MPSLDGHDWRIMALDRARAPTTPPKPATLDNRRDQHQTNHNPPTPMTQAEALTNALWSAIHCPENMAKKFTDLAEELAQGMSQAEIERCKEVALKMESPE